MKIVYCINNTWYSGGMTRVLANKANYFARNGHEVTIITTDQGKHIPHYPLDDRIVQVDLGINYLALDQKHGFEKIFKSLLYLWRHHRILKRTLFGLRADVVISMFTREMFVLPQIPDGSTKIIEIHTSRYNWLQLRRSRGILGKIQNGIDVWAIKRFHHFVVLTEEDKAYWKEINRISAIPNANTFEPQESAPLDNKVVLAVGRYDQGKNFKDAIAAWKIVRERFPDWKLRVVGDGALREALQKQIEAESLQDVVELHPGVNNIKAMYLMSSVLLFTSLYEGLGMVLLEAQACGLPLVAYSCPCGPSEIITQGENGFLTAVGDTDALADRTMFLLGNEHRRKQMGMSARKHALRFSEELIMEKWLRLFDELRSK